MATPFKGRFKIDENDDGNYAIVGINGSPISEFYAEIEYFTDDLAKVYNDKTEKYALMATDGHLTSKWYSEIEEFKDNYLLGYDDSRGVYALLDGAGKRLSDWYSSIEKSKKGFAVVTDARDDYALIDANGQLISNWVEDEDELTAPVGSVIEATTPSTNSSTPTKKEPIVVSKSSTPQLQTSAAGFKTKVIDNLEMSIESTNPEDYIETLNTISSEMGGVTNLGVFCDIKSIEHTSALLSDVEEQFIHVEVVKDEQPYNYLNNDGSSTKPYDYDFDFLLNH